MPEFMPENITVSGSYKKMYREPGVLIFAGKWRVPAVVLFKKNLHKSRMRV